MQHSHRRKYKKYSKLLTIIGFLFLLTIVPAQTALQFYPLGKIYLKSGQVIEGKKLEIFKNEARLEVSGYQQVINIEDVRQIMAKKGKAKDMGKICGGSCLGLALASYLVSGGQTEDEYGNTTEIGFGQYLLGTGIWVAIFYGGGYLTGMLMDNWEPVYFGQ